MKWATRDQIHFDRVVSAWLILRFVDKDAEFLFLEKGAAAPSDATPFGIPGGRLGSHNDTVTTFQQILRTYEITDVALEELGRIGADVVAHVMLDGERSLAAGRDALTGGLLAIAEGTMLLSATDDECLERSIPIYDALYVRIQAQNEIVRQAPSPPATVLDQTALLAEGVRGLRGAGASYSEAAFSDALGTKQIS